MWLNFRPLRQKPLQSVLIPDLPHLQDPEKLKARAERFGLQKSAANARASNNTTPVGQKRAADVAEVEEEELERRRKRAERFKTAVSVLDSPSSWISHAAIIDVSALNRRKPEIRIFLTVLAVKSDALPPLIGSAVL